MLLILVLGCVLVFALASWVRRAAPNCAVMLVLMVGVPLILLVLVFGMASL